MQVVFGTLLYYNSIIGFLYLFIKDIKNIWKYFNKDIPGNQRFKEKFDQIYFEYFFAFNKNGVL